MTLRRQSLPIESKGGQHNEIGKLGNMFSGIWVILNSFLGPKSIWEDIVFGAIAAILALIATFRIKE